MTRKLALIFVLSNILLISGCSDNKITNLQNQVPVITALSANPEQAYLGDMVTVSSTAYDPEGGKLNYNWSTTFGYFIGSGATVTFNTAHCCVVGLNEITLTVADNQGYFSQRKIWVNIEK